MILRVLMSAPSLDTRKNVSGVSSVFRNIVAAMPEDVVIEHLPLGSTDQSSVLTSLAQTISSIFKAATGRYDVFHSNTAFNAKSIIRDTLVCVLARSTGHKVILHIHGGEFLFSKMPHLLRPLTWLLAWSATHIVVLSELEADIVRRLFPGASVNVIYNGAVPESPAHSSDIAMGATRFLFMGRYVPEKGLTVLLRTIEELVISPTVSFDFYGSGPLAQDIRAMSERRPDTKMHPPFPAEQLRDVLANYDVLLLPSLSGEGMPMAIIEAMHAGLVPISTATASISEIVVDGVTGLLTAPGSNSELKDAISKLADNVELRRTLAISARRFANANLSSLTNYSALVPLYEL